MKYGEESKPPFVEELRAVKKRKIDAKLTTQAYVMRLKYMVQAMDGNCTVCIVNNLDVSKGYDHMANYCPHLDFHVFLKWKKNIWYNPQTHGPICTCFHLPQIDNSLHKWISQGKSTFSECPYPDRTLPLAYAIYCHTSTCHSAESAFKNQWPTDIQYAKWLCGKPVAASKTNTMLILL